MKIGVILSLVAIFFALFVIMFLWGKVSALGNNDNPANGSSTPSDLSDQNLLQPPTQVPDGKGQEVIITEKQGPRKISEHLDLAIGLADQDKFVFIVQRADGTFSEIIVPATHKGDIRLFMGLGPNDEIVNGYPLIPLPSFPALKKPE